MRNGLRILTGVFSALILTVGIGCGSDNTVTVGGLDDLPNSSDAVKTSTTAVQHGPIDLTAFLIESAPTVKTTLTSAANIDTYFFNGLIDDIVNQGLSVTETVRENFYAGMNACHSAQDLIAGIEKSESNSTCYMKGMANLNATNEAALAPPEVGQTKTIAVNVTNMSMGEGEGSESMTVHIIIGHAEDSTVSYTLEFCDSSGAYTGEVEQISVNAETGVYSTKSYANSQGRVRASVISAILQQGASGLDFNPNQNRTASTYYSESWGIHNSVITIAGDATATIQSYGEWSEGANSSTHRSNKKFEIGLVEGTEGPLERVRFDNFGYSQTGTWGNDSYTHTGNGYFNGTYYEPVASSHEEAIYAEAVAALEYIDGTAPTTGLENYANTCANAASAQYQIEMDFSSAEIIAIQEECDGNRLGENFWNACRSATSTAEGMLW